MEAAVMRELSAEGIYLSQWEASRCMAAVAAGAPHGAAELCRRWKRRELELRHVASPAAVQRVLGCGVYEAGLSRGGPAVLVSAALQDNAESSQALLLATMWACDAASAEELGTPRAKLPCGLVVGYDLEGLSLRRNFSLVHGWQFSRLFGLSWQYPSLARQIYILGMSPAWNTLLSWARPLIPPGVTLEFLESRDAFIKLTEFRSHGRLEHVAPTCVPTCREHLGQQRAINLL